MSKPSSAQEHRAEAASENRRADAAMAEEQEAGGDDERRARAEAEERRASRSAEEHLAEAKAEEQRADFEERSVMRASKLNSRLIYEVIRRDGQDELERPVGSLVWSGIAAGVLIGFSFVGQAAIAWRLPQTTWAPLVADFGYTLGFLLVILGRMQLFTENTITTVLPIMAKPTWPIFNQVLRLWGVVLGANVLGALAAGIFLTLFPSVPAELLPSLTDLAQKALDLNIWQSFWRAIPAGLLIAALVWMLPQAGGQQIVLIVIFTWLISAGDFSHIIAGSVEMWFLLFRGEIGLFGALFSFFIPVLLGNVIGGTAIFTLLAWGQVREEVETA